MTTNACKYGALSGPNGNAMLEWELEDGACMTSLVPRWREIDETPVNAPTRKGLGSPPPRNVGYRLCGLEADGPRSFPSE